MAEVIRLASIQPRPVRACATCRHATLVENPVLNACAAVGEYTGIERLPGRACGPAGLLWEPRPLRTIGIFERAWRFLFGGR